MNNKVLWGIGDCGSFHFDDQFEAQQAEFIASQEGEVITKSVNFYTARDALDVITDISKFLPGSHVTGVANNAYLLVGSLDKPMQPKRCLLAVRGNNLYEGKPITVWVTVSGHRKVVEEILTIAAKYAVVVKRGKVTWWFKTFNQGLSHKEISLEDNPAEEIRPEYYPGLGDPAKFVEDYLNSKAPVLILGGVPGTGKTTLLRKMLTAHSLETYVAYDHEVMKDESLLQGFMFSDADVFVFEDAEQLMLPRLSGNEVMARFLNVSSGLISLPKKKIIFTTNFLNLKKVDEGLIREGRCFAATTLEPLTYNQSLAACKVAGLTPPADPKKSYTLAQLFNQG